MFKHDAITNTMVIKYRQNSTVLILPLYFRGKSSTRAFDCLLSALASMGGTSYNQNKKQNINLTQNNTDYERLQMKYVGA